MAAATPSPNQEPDGPDATCGFAGQVALLAELLEAEPAALTEGEVADGVVALAKLSGQVDAALGSLVGSLDARAIHTGDGAPSAGSWVAARSELSRQHAGAVAARQRDLRACPHVAEAYRLGLIGTAKVRMLLSARHRVEEVFAEHEADLVETLRPLTVDHARFAAARWRSLALDLAGLDEDAAPTDPTANSLHVSATSGRYDLSGDLDVVTGNGFVADLDAEIADLFRDGRFTTDDGLVRSQRRAVALAELTARARRGTRPVTTTAATAPDGDTSDTSSNSHGETEAPHEHDPHGDTSPDSKPSPESSGDSGGETEAHRDTDPGGVPDPSDETDLAAGGAGTPDTDANHQPEPGTGFGRTGVTPAGSDPPPPPTPAEPVLGTGPSVSVVVDLALLASIHDHDLGAALARRCHLGDGTPIPVSCAQRLLCTGSIDPVLVDRLLDATTDIAAVTSPARTATRTQRRALVERDRGCVFPGCRAGPARCEAHHVVPWSHGGSTTLSNLVLVCRHHHHACHEGGFTLTLTNGTVTVTRPDGTTLPRTHHGDQVIEPVTIDDPPDPPDPCSDGAHPDASGGTRAPSRYRELTHRLDPRDHQILDRRRRQRADATRTRLGLPPPTITTERWRLTRIDAA